MTGHFTTLDGCERWGTIVTPCTEFYKVPYSSKDPYHGTQYRFRVYRLESIEPSRGLAHYVEVA